MLVGAFHRGDVTKSFRINQSLRFLVMKDQAGNVCAGLDGDICTRF